MLKPFRKSTFWYPTTGKALFPTQRHKIENRTYLFFFFFFKLQNILVQKKEKKFFLHESWCEDVKTVFYPLQETKTGPKSNLTQ